jgi:hypothetical protein
MPLPLAGIPLELNIVQVRRQARKGRLPETGASAFGKKLNGSQLYLLLWLPFEKMYLL